MSTELLARARAGDREAFAALVEPHRGELQVHCYRMLGSLQDAEDALQETLLSAWLGLEGFEGRSSVRTWLYRIATNRCLNVLRSSGRRPVTAAPLPIQAPEPTRIGEVLWLQPYPDVLLDGLSDQAPGPEARYESREAISLAFVTAVQLLPPNQRAVLLLRDGGALALDDPAATYVPELAGWTYGAADAAPAAVIVGHGGLGLLGLTVWTLFMATGWAALAWISVGLLAPVAGLGLTVLLTGLPRSRPAAASSLSPTRSGRPSAAIIAGHGLFVVATLLLALLAAIGA